MNIKLILLSLFFILPVMSAAPSLPKSNNIWSIIISLLLNLTLDSKDLIILENEEILPSMDQGFYQFLSYRNLSRKKINSLKEKKS